MGEFDGEGDLSERFLYESEEEGFYIGWDIGDIFDICMEFGIVLYWGYLNNNVK